KILRRRLCVRARRCVSPCWRWRYPLLCTRLLASAQRHRPCFGNGCCRVVCRLLGWPSAVVGAFELCVCHGTRGHCRLGWHQVAIRGNRHWHVNCCVGLGGCVLTLGNDASRYGARLVFFYLFLARSRGRNASRHVRPVLWGRFYLRHYTASRNRRWFGSYDRQDRARLQPSDCPNRREYNGHLRCSHSSFAMKGMFPVATSSYSPQSS